MIVFVGGDPVDPSVRDLLPAGAHVIAADSGVEQAQALDWPIDLAIGDFDSVGPEALAEAEQAGARIERHPTAKDATDLELALDAAASLDPAEIVVVGGAGGRLDHLLGGILALAGERAAGAEVRALMGPARIHVVRRRVELVGEPGELVTLLAVHGPARGITTTGLLYPLAGEELTPGSTRGVSNELVGRRATVTVDSGVLLAVLPGELGTHQLPTAPPSSGGPHP